MSNYVKSTNFTAKDSLPTGDANKVIRGSEFDTEFNAIQVASATKADLGSPTFTGTATFDNITVTGNADLTSASVSININGGTIDDTVIGGTTPAAGTFTDVVGTTGTFSGAVSGTTGTFSGAVSGTTGTFSGDVTGSNLNIANWDTAYGWGNHATAGYLTSVAFTDIDAGAVTLSSETFTDVDNQIPTNAAVIDYVAATIPEIAEVNDLSAVVTWTTVPDEFISASSVNQHVTLEKATQTKTYTNGETSTITLSQAITSGAPVVSVTKEVPQTGSTNNDWDAAPDSYTLEDSAYDTTLDIAPGLKDARYAGKSFFNGQESALQGVFLKDDGTKMYLIGYNGRGVFQYTLSTAYDVSTASYDSVTFDPVTQESLPSGLFFKPDGTKMYILGYAKDTVFQYSLSTAWDISSVTYDSVSFNVSSQESQATFVQMNDVGTKMYISGFNDNVIYQYSLSTAYDVSTASYDSISFDPSAQDADLKAFAFVAGGAVMITAGSTNPDALYEYRLSTPYNVGTAVYTSKSLSTASQDSQPNGLYIAPNGNAYVAGGAQRKIFQYSLPFESVALGSGSFASTDVGKTINVNDGALVLTATDGSFDETTAPTSYNTAASGSWSMNAVVYDATDDVLEVSQFNPAYGLADASYTGNSRSLSQQEANPFGIAFDDTGTKMYAVGFTNKAVYQYPVSTPFDLSTATGPTRSLNVAPQVANPRGITFTPDGSTLFVNDYDNDDLTTYTLSPAWDVSTGSVTSDTFSYTSEGVRPCDMHFSPDGTKLLVSLADNSSRGIFQYNLSTAFDITTMTYSGNSFEPADKYRAIAASPDGLTLLLGDQNTGKVDQYSLSSAFDVSTITFVRSFDVSFLGTSIVDAMVFDNDGSKFFVVGSSAIAYEFSTGDPVRTTGYQPCISSNIDTTFWTDINSLTATDAVGSGNVFYAVSNDARDSWSVLDNTSGTRDIVRNNAGTWQYNSNGTYGSETWANATTNTEVAALREAMTGATVTTQNYDISTAVFVDNFSVASQEPAPHGFSFSSTGHKMYVVGTTNDTVYEYNLSTVFDISTASYTTSFSVAAQDTTPRDVVLSTDGTKMFVAGDAGNDINEYTLSTAYDVSSASYVTAYAVVEPDLWALAFKPDGTKMYILGYGTDFVREFTLSTPYDLTTVSYVHKFSVGAQDTLPTGLDFSTDGTKMFVAGNSTQDVFEYTLSTAFDVSTATYVQNYGVNIGGFSKVRMNSDGTKMFTGNYSYQNIGEYTLGTTAYTNQMDSTKLNAITEANQITLGDDLDFAAILYYASGSTVPTYSGTAIDYDANVVNQGAVLGTDYNWDFPSSTTVRLTSLGDYNLKVRII